MPTRAAKIIDELYGEELKPARRSGYFKLFRRKRKRPKRVRYISQSDSRVLDLYRERSKTLTKARLLVLIGLALAAFLFGISIYYFNILTRSEQDVFKERAKIDTLLQRRRNLSVNLAKSVQDYAIHEQGIFQHVSQMRGSSKEGKATDSDQGAKPANGADPPPAAEGQVAQENGVVTEILAMLENPGAGGLGLGDKLSGLMAVAESYPDLKLSDNFRRFMDALIETEKDLSDERMKYSEIVNNYSTQLRTFPSRFFGMVYGFEPLPYYEADTEAKGFRPIEY